ncbi:hypothetical protein [Luteipulveratus mongoliensis]|uniref:SH3b domain-containing protein n=1 Tax=Luteipulveratus mongoliensis TaxID=571913 RepID=A0A0K1JG62_9MICO|nr:hypothetical protein [Luteipulveratus mongoliensis]AKU15578.1 hypothetical protein VV02_06420 [Luteipulveratus mongoliensis]
MKLKNARFIGAVAATGGVVALALSTGAGAAQAANYTHPTTTTGACHVYGNYPKAGIDAYGWDVGPNTPLGVRYTFNDYALIKDSARASDPLHWGFIAKSCLADPHAYDNSFTTPLPDLRAVGGDGNVKDVIIAPTPGNEVHTIHVTSPGTLRNEPMSFAIGNVRDGEEFHITTATCGVHDPASWIYGRATTTGRWGWVQASHLNACT